MKIEHNVLCKHIIESIGEGLILTNLEGQIQYINQKAQILTGYTATQANGKQLDKVVVFHYSRTDLPILDIISKTNENQRFLDFDEEIYLINSHKEANPISLKVYRIIDKDDIMILFLLDDQSRIKEYEIEMQKALRLNSLGKLSSGIAHDFNNILTSILGNISLAKMDIDEKSEIADLLEDAELGIEKARTMTEQLLTFSQDKTTEHSLLDLHQLLHQTIDFTLSGSNVTCKYSVPEDLWMIHAAKAEISQALHNIIINAVQAMPIGGLIELIGENVTLYEKNLYKLKPGNYVQLIIKDQGIGIPSEELPFVFDPFYKSHHTGKGMGLIVVKNIMAQHFGDIFIDSEIDKGTSVYLFLPAKKTVAKPKESVQKFPKIKSGKILIMDDEIVIRKVLTKMLEQLGYFPEAVSNGEMAIETYKHHLETGERFDAVILDLTIKGGMGGMETQKALIEIDPNVKSVASSGYSTDEIITNYEKYGFKGKLVKPYKVNELKELLIQILSKK